MQLWRLKTFGFKIIGNSEDVARWTGMMKRLFKLVCERWIYLGTQDYLTV